MRSMIRPRLFAVAPVLVVLAAGAYYAGSATADDAATATDGKGTATTPSRRNRTRVEKTSSSAARAAPSRRTWRSS